MSNDKRQTLEQAVHLARTERSKDLRRAAFILHGLPVGGWAQTTEAVQELRDLLPLREQRSYTFEQFVEAAYELRSHGDAADTYHARLMPSFAIHHRDGEVESGFDGYGGWQKAIAWLRQRYRRELEYTEPTPPNVREIAAVRELPVYDGKVLIATIRRQPERL